MHPSTWSAVLLAPALVHPRVTPCLKRPCIQVPGLPYATCTCARPSMSDSSLSVSSAVCLSQAPAPTQEALRSMDADVPLSQVPLCLHLEHAEFDECGTHTKRFTARVRVRAPKANAASNMCLAGSNNWHGLPILHVVVISCPSAAFLLTELLPSPSTPAFLGPIGSPSKWQALLPPITSSGAVGARPPLKASFCK